MLQEKLKRRGGHEPWRVLPSGHLPSVYTTTVGLQSFGPPFLHIHMYLRYWYMMTCDMHLCICTFCKMILCTSGYIYRNLPLPPAVPAPQPHQSLLLPFGLSTAALLSDSMWRFPSRSKRLGKNRHISGSLQFSFLI